MVSYFNNQFHFEYYGLSTQLCFFRFLSQKINKIIILLMEIPMF